MKIKFSHAEILAVDALFTEMEKDVTGKLPFSIMHKIHKNGRLVKDMAGVIRKSIEYPSMVKDFMAMKEKLAFKYGQVEGDNVKITDPAGFKAAIDSLKNDFPKLEEVLNDYQAKASVYLDETIEMEFDMIKSGVMEDEKLSSLVLPLPLSKLLYLFMEG